MPFVVTSTDRTSLGESELKALFVSILSVSGPLRAGMPYQESFAISSLQRPQLSVSSVSSNVIYKVRVKLIWHNALHPG